MGIQLVDTHGLTPVALEIRSSAGLALIQLLLKLNVSLYGFFINANRG